MRIHNEYCDGAHCKSPEGEVKLYPLGGHANLILCFDCWVHENKYRFSRAMEHGPGGHEKWPQQNWFSAEVYHNG